MNKNSPFPHVFKCDPEDDYHHSDLSDVEVEELHHETVGASVVDVGRALDQVVLGRAQSVQDVSLSL